MPELPDIHLYTQALKPRVVGRTLDRIIIRGPFLLRSVEPPVDTAEGRSVRAVGRLGKRITFELEGGLWVVVHLMIAGRFLWKAPGSRPTGRIDLAAMDFGDAGTLILTEASTRKRAGLWILDAAGLAAMDPGGLDVLACTPAQFTRTLRLENRTLKRALTNPRMFDGIGNAYSDEILHTAKFSPVKLTQSLTDEQAALLHAATKKTLIHWRDRLLDEFGAVGGAPGRFPKAGEITAFRPDFAVHGRFGKPCPICGDPVQRIVHAENEVNYCATCQTGGRVLADRSLSRLLKDDWPRTIEEWETTFQPGESKDP